MNNYGEIIEKMSQFLLEEPSGEFHAIDHKSEDIIWHRAFRTYGLERMAEFSNKFDETQELTLLYLARFCKFIIENTTCPVTEALIGSPQLEMYRECLGLATSKEVMECNRALVEKMAQAVSAISSRKLLGNDMEALGKAVDDAVDAVFETFANLRFEIYLNSGKPIGSLATTSLSVQACNSLAECLIRLEKSPDGIYVCYISNPGTLDGWFGFFVKSNGNLFSYNERIDEAYIGQHGNMRNGRYAEGKAYDLFPYELCKASEETDYKGYSKDISIGDNLNLMGGDGNDFSIVMRMLLSMAVIAKHHGGKTIDGDPVIVNSLLPNNLALLENKESAADTTAVVEWQGSPIVEYTAKCAAPSFEVSNVLNGEYNREFNEMPKCIFTGSRQEIVDAYGAGFTIDNTKVLSSDSSLRLIGNGESEQEFIGSKDRLRAQAYYEVREQLCDYIEQKMEDDLQSFGGQEALGRWYRERLDKKKDAILRYCLKAFDAMKTDDEGNGYGCIYINSDKDAPGLDSRFLRGSRAVACRASSRTGMGFWGYFMLSQSKDYQRRCWITGCAPSYYFRFDFYNFKQVEEFLGCSLPKFCVGWERDHNSSGNSILSMVDPIDDMIHPLMDRRNPFRFDFAVALSKSAINKIRKELGNG